MSNEQPKEPMMAESLFRKYFSKALNNAWIKDLENCLQEYAAQEVAKALTEKDAEIKQIKCINAQQTIRNELIINQMDNDHRDIYYENKKLKSKISVLEANVLASVARAEAAEKMAEALTSLRHEAFSMYSCMVDRAVIDGDGETDGEVDYHEAMQKSEEALDAWNAAKEGVKL